MQNRRRMVAAGFLGVGLCLAMAGSAFPQEDDIVREGDLRAADHARPGSWDHVDELALDLKKLAEDLHDQVHAHLEGHLYFEPLDEHAEEIEALANHIHELAHQGKSIKHLRADVDELDGQVHHARDVVTKIARHGVVSRHYEGGVNQTRRIASAMNDILHHLQDDLAELDPDYRPDFHETRRPIPNGAPLHRRPSEEYHSRYPHRGYDRFDEGHEHLHPH